MRKAHERYVELTNRGRHGRVVSMQYTRGTSRGPALPDVREETIRFWWSPPDRLREETTSNIPHQTRTVVIGGELWWLYGEARDAITNELLDEEERAHHGVGGGEHVKQLLDPSWLIPALEIDAIEVAGPSLHVQARQRTELEPHHRHLHLIAGADRFELEVDREIGIVRALTAFIDGEELSSMRLAELHLGETLPDELFARPAGVEFERPGGNVREVTLEQAAAELPFAVFSIPDLPDGLWRLRINLMRRPQPGLWLVYHRADGRETFTISQSAEDHGIEGERVVALERDGTHLVLQSDSLDAEALRGLTDRLERFTG